MYLCSIRHKTLDIFKLSGSIIWKQIFSANAISYALYCKIITICTKVTNISDIDTLFSISAWCFNCFCYRNKPTIFVKTFLLPIRTFYNYVVKQIAIIIIGYIQKFHRIPTTANHGRFLFVENNYVIIFRIRIHACVKSYYRSCIS